jgi:hypothetical protein
MLLGELEDRFGSVPSSSRRITTNPNPGAPWMHLLALFTNKSALTPA